MSGWARVPIQRMAVMAPQPPTTPSMETKTARRCWCGVGPVGLEKGDVWWERIIVIVVVVVVFGAISEGGVGPLEEESLKSVAGRAMTTTPTRDRKAASCCCLENDSPGMSRAQT